MEKVLVITDDKSLGDSLASMLKIAGYQAFLVTDGNTASQSIADTLPHLVLLDVSTGNIDGLSILTRKLAEPLLAKIPVFLLSTQGAPINMKNIPQRSVTEFIVALHGQPEEILERVNKFFGKEKQTTPVKPVPTGQLKTILWVEDDRLIGNILGKKLVSSGFNLIHAKNGEEAMQKMTETRPDAIVVDLLLPGMSGFEILEQIKKQDRFKKIPTMVLSNLSKPSDIEKAKNLGAQRFLVKATESLDQIVGEVRNLLK